MALASPIQEYRRPADRLHYFHPFRAGLSMMVIIAGGSELVAWGWFTARDGRTVLESAILTAILLFLVVRIFLPRTLTVDRNDIRWTIRFRPPYRATARSGVRAIQFLTTSGPGQQRYYFVDADGEAVLWVDRFTPAQMLSFANYLGVPIRPVETVPDVEDETRTADARWRAYARKRAQVAAFAVVGLIGLALTIFLAVVAFKAVSEWSSYQRAGLCQRPPMDPLSCRLEMPATVTELTNQESWTKVYLRFSQNVLAGGDQRSTFVWLQPGNHPQPALAVGEPANAEVFNRIYITALNGAYTRDYGLMRSNATWWYAAIPAIIPIVMGFFAYGSWKSDISGYGDSKDEPKRKFSLPRSWVRRLRPIGRAASRLWMAWVG